ncbi:unnamed protein product [Calicophoron daubneyi]|uniref:Rootletin-like coiled-coil domain-containing protein n=1 Tax=Calicophoron daubneyi TaxID=300641 RepID=A0AAV2TCN3_CALDB
MDGPAKNVENVVKDSVQQQSSNQGEEISLDRFFHLAGMEPAQIEALCSSEVSDTTGTVVNVNSEKSQPNESSTTDMKPSLTETSPRSKLDEETASYKRKIAAYQEGQQKQAQLIQKLQTKVLQYKKRTSDLELEVEQLKSELENSDKVLRTTTENLNSRIDASEARARVMEQERSYDLESTISKLQAEQQRANELTQANEVLREQLEQAVQANQGLSQDVARLTLAWRNAAQQLDKRETEWREEESAFNDYFAAEHSRLLALWRAVVALRRQFSELRQQTDRDLSHARSELVQYVHNIQASCNNLQINLKEAEAEAQATQKQRSNQVSVLEAEAADRLRTLSESLARSQSRLAETENKLTETIAAKERLAVQLADRDRILSTMSQLRSGICTTLEDPELLGRGKKRTKRAKSTQNESETSAEDDADQSLTLSEGAEDHLKATKLLIEHTHVMHQALTQIAHLVISDSVIADQDEAEDPTLSIQHVDWSNDPTTNKQIPSIMSAEMRLRKSPISASEATANEKGKQKSNSPEGIGEFEDSVESDQPLKRLYSINQGDIASLRRLAQSKYKAGSSLHLAESTVSAVQTALNRRAAHVHRLRYRTQGLKDQIQSLVRRGEELETERQKATDQLAKLREDLEAQCREYNKLTVEKDRIKHNLNLTAEEHKISETTRLNLSEQVHDLQSEIEHNRSLVLQVSKQRDETSGELNKLQADHDRISRELKSVKASLEGAEERAANYREELVNIRESLKRTELEKEVLGQEKTEAMGTAAKVQSRITDLEQKICQAHLRETQLKDKVSQLEVMVEAHERDNYHLNQQAALAQSSELRLYEERSSLRAERQHLRDELEKLYAERGSLRSEIDRARENIADAETAKNRLESESAALSHERVELVEALNNAERQKAGALEDLNNLRRENDRQAEIIDRLSHEREAVLKQKSELLLQLSMLERDARQMSEQIVKLKDEKETLEAHLFDSQQLLEQLQSRQNQQENEISDLRLRRDTLQAELYRAHANFQVELDKSQRTHQEMGSQLNTELEDLRSALNQAERRAKEAEEACIQAVLRADQAVSVMGRQQQAEVDTFSDRESELKRSAEEVSRLTRALLDAQRERDEARLHAEQERQRALIRAADEKASLQERVSLLQQTITELQTALDRSHQEFNVRGNQERSALRKATEEIRKFRNQLEESCSTHEREVRELRLRIRDLEGQRDQLRKEANDLQLQAKLAEESRDGNRAELLEITCRMRAAEEASDAKRLECTELRQKIGELEREKNALDASNEELRRQLKTAEMERVELVRMTNVTRSQLQGTEMDRTTAERRVSDLQESMKEVTAAAAEARREASELKSKLKKVSMERTSLDQEINELRAQIKNVEAREEVVKRERNALKQKLSDSESLNSSLQSELSNVSRQLADTEEAMRARERAANQAAEDWNRDYRRLDDVKSTLEAKLEQSNLLVGELRASLAESQTHLRGVEAELSETLSTKQEAEARLSAIHSIFRRLLGFRQSQYLSRTGLLNKVEHNQLKGDQDPEGLDGIDENSGLVRKGNELIQAGMKSRDADMEEIDNELELRRMAETVLSERNRLINRINTGPKPRQRGGRRLYGNSEHPAFIRRVHSLTAARRSKSASPQREHNDENQERWSSNERHSFSKNRTADGMSDRDECGSLRLSGDLSMIDWSSYWWQTMRADLSGMRYRGLPGSDLDPEAVRLVLKDFLRHLIQIERERDTYQLKTRTTEEELSTIKKQLSECEGKANQLQLALNAMEKGKAEVSGQLDSLKAVITEQESVLLKRDTAHNALRDKFQLKEQQLAVCQSEKQQLQSRLEKAKSSEMSLEEDRRRLLKALDDAETRYTQAEVARRRLEGELQRAVTSLDELKKNKETLESRLEATTRRNNELDTKVYTLSAELEQINQALNQATMCADELKTQLEREQMNQMALKQELNELNEHLTQLNARDLANEQERRLLQERLEMSRTNLNDTKAQLHDTLERLQDLQLESSDAALRRSELETQMQQLANAASESQQVSKELQTRLSSLQNENTENTEKNSELLRRVNDLGLEKHELECEVTRLRREQNQWKKSIDRVTNERNREQEVNQKLSNENKELTQSIRRLENENLDLRRSIQKIQASMAKQEETQAARLVEFNTKQRVEIEAEMERQRAALQQAEKSYQAKDRSQRQQIRGLEEQVSLLKDQLAQEMNRRQLFTSKSQNFSSPSQPNLLSLGSASAELGDICAILDGSLPRNAYLPGLYKPTTAPSRFDPYYCQVTGSIPSQLDRSIGVAANNRFVRNQDERRTVTGARMGRPTMSDVTNQSPVRPARGRANQNNNNNNPSAGDSGRPQSTADPNTDSSITLRSSTSRNNQQPNRPSHVSRKADDSSPSTHNPVARRRNL